MFSIFYRILFCTTYIYFKVWDDDDVKILLIGHSVKVLHLVYTFKILYYTKKNQNQSV